MRAFSLLPLALMTFVHAASAIPRNVSQLNLDSVFAAACPCCIVKPANGTHCPGTFPWGDCAITWTPIIPANNPVNHTCDVPNAPCEYADTTPSNPTNDVCSTFGAKIADAPPCNLAHTFRCTKRLPGRCNMQNFTNGQSECWCVDNLNLPPLDTWFFTRSGCWANDPSLMPLECP